MRSARRSAKAGWVKCISPKIPSYMRRERNLHRHLFLVSPGAITFCYSVATWPSHKPSMRSLIEPNNSSRSSARTKASISRRDIPRLKRADYAFLAPNFRDVRFFVEAKKPHAGIDNPTFYFQTIRYGWNNKTPLSVLTDFEELRVLDCRYKPDISTALGHAVLKYHYADYADKEKFRTIYHLFSREAVLNGSIESFAKGMPKLSRKRPPRGVATDEHQSIDESFLQELDDFREELARAYKRKNPELDTTELTEVTQRTLDRLVFMRFLEDKLIESDPLIEDLHKKGKTWENFIATSRRLDRVYNG